MKKIKVMYNVMYKYGMKYDICPRDLSSYIDIIQYHKRNPKKEDRNPFTIEQSILSGLYQKICGMT